MMSEELFGDLYDSEALVPQPAANVLKTYATRRRPKDKTLYEDQQLPALDDLVEAEAADGGDVYKFEKEFSKPVKSRGRQKSLRAKKVLFLVFRLTVKW